MNCHCYQIILLKKRFYTIREPCEVLTGYFLLSCRPSGRIRDTGQNLVQSSFKTANSSSLSYFHSFFLIVSLEKSCIINTCMNYTEWAMKKQPGSVDQTDESRPTTCDRGRPAVEGGEMLTARLPLPPQSLVVLDCMLLALTHQSSLRTRVTLSWPIMYNHDTHQ